jgi:Tryptophan-associated transmembrane protein (Trp_oprn_chp)
VSARRYVDLLVLVALALLGGSAFLTWTTADPGDGRPAVDLDGSDVTDAPLTIAVAALVAAVVLRLAGKVTRWLLAMLLVVLGGAATAVGALTRPDAGQLARLRPELGQVTAVGTGPAPWLAVAGGVALVAAGVLALLTARGWRGPATRFERDGGGADTDPWRAIDAGEDPTV